MVFPPQVTATGCPVSTIPYRRQIIAVDNDTGDQLFAAVPETAVREIRIVQKTFSGINFFSGINDTDQFLTDVVTLSL